MVLMLFYWAAAAALISFSYFLAAFFTRTQLASLLSPLLYFLAMLPAFIAVSFQVRHVRLFPRSPFLQPRSSPWGRGGGRI